MYSRTRTFSFSPREGRPAAFLPEHPRILPEVILENETGNTDMRSAEKGIIGVGVNAHGLRSACVGLVSTSVDSAMHSLLPPGVSSADASSKAGTLPRDQTLRSTKSTIDHCGVALQRVT